MNQLIKAIEAEFRRYQALAEGALEQVSDEQLSAPGPNNGNSLAVICWHISGNLQSRFTDFLESDGEKPWRQREEEFAARTVTRAELLAKWATGWNVLLSTLGTLRDEDLGAEVAIRGRSLLVHEALFRAMAHISYHVGQIVYLAHAHRGEGWKYLSIPPGGSAAYNADPRFEKPSEQAGALGAKSVK